MYNTQQETSFFVLILHLKKYRNVYSSEWSSPLAVSGIKNALSYHDVSVKGGFSNALRA